MCRVCTRHKKVHIFPIFAKNVSCAHMTQKVLLFPIFENVSCAHMTQQRLRKNNLRRRGAGAYLSHIFAENVSCAHMTQKVLLFPIFENVSCAHMTQQAFAKTTCGAAAPGGLVGAGGRSRDARPFKRSVNGRATEHHSRYQSPHARCDPPPPPPPPPLTPQVT